MDLSSTLQGAAAGSSFGLPGAAIGAGAGALGLFGNPNAGADAAKSNADAALAAQQAWQAKSDPFTASGDRAKFEQTYTPQLQNLIANPGSAFSDPTFQASLQQGDQAVSRQMNASGMLNSGNEMAALQNYGQSHALDFYNTKLQQLEQLSGQSTPAQQTTPTSSITPGNAYNMANAPGASLMSSISTLGSSGALNNIFNGSMFNSTPTGATTTGQDTTPGGDLMSPMGFGGQ